MTIIVSLLLVVSFFVGLYMGRLLPRVLVGKKYITHKFGWRDNDVTLISEVLEEKDDIMEIKVIAVNGIPLKKSPLRDSRWGGDYFDKMIPTYLHKSQMIEEENKRLDRLISGMET